MKTDTTIYREIMWAERKVDCYDGPECDGHRPFWGIYAEGDRDGSGTDEPLTLKPGHFPPGTKVTVEVPVCPECDCDAGMCGCGFDWKQWAEDRYA